MNRFEDEEDENRILRDGETFNCRLMLKDSITKSDEQIALDATQAVKMRDAAILNAAHKPGFRYAAPVMTDAAAARNAARNAMYDESDRLESERWRGKSVSDSIDTRSVQYDAVSARAAKEAAYDFYDADLAARYRK